MRSNKGHFKECNAIIEKQDRVPGAQGCRAEIKSEPFIVEMDDSNGALHPCNVPLHTTQTRIEDPDIDNQEKRNTL